MLNEPAAVMLSVKPATCDATASPEVAATSALICASSSAGGPARSLLQATAPAARNIAAAVSMGFLNFIKKSAPEGVLRRNAAAINTKERANRNAPFHSARLSTPRPLIGQLAGLTARRRGLRYVGENLV